MRILIVRGFSLRGGFPPDSIAGNVYWIIQKCPHLENHNLPPEQEKLRNEQTFEGTKVSSASPSPLFFLYSLVPAARLLLFHVYFLKLVGRPEGMTLSQIADNYDARCGRPSAQMKEDLQVLCSSRSLFRFHINAGTPLLQRACKEIFQLASWDEFFTRIGLVRKYPNQCKEPGH